jgi:uncharacterized protein
MPSRLFSALSDVKRAALSHFAPESRADGWQNNVTGLGTSRDKTTHGQFLARYPLSDQTLSNLYHHDDMAARMVDIVPDEMFREGFIVDLGDPDASQATNDKLTDLEVRQVFTEAGRWGRLFGGAAILIGADDGRPAEKELVPERARDVDWLYVVDRRYLWPLTYYTDPRSRNYGKPETFMVSPTGSAVNKSPQIVHESRLILFGGAPTAEQERIQNGHWDYSVLQRPYEVLRQFNTGWAAVENLLTDGHQAVFKMAGLADALASGEKDYLEKRAQLIDMGRSVVRAMIVDAGTETDTAEDFTRHSVSFSDIPATLEKYMLRLAAAVQIPVTILMGQSPAGMNATGDSDFRWFYDRIRSGQNNEQAPRIRKLVDIWLRTKDAPRLKEAPTVKVTFPPLWTETPVAEAARKASIAATDALYITNGVYTPEEVALIRSQPGGFDQDVHLSEAGIEAREGALGIELESMLPDEDADE